VAAIPWTFVDIPEIDIAGLAEKLDEGASVFDVRQPDEYEEAHVPGVVLIPLNDVPDRVGEFPTDATVYVICKSGGRSAKATEFLRAQGVDAVNVAGGTMGWIEAGKPVETGA
jgi:rhodanese-related sulfurtransferase